MKATDDGYPFIILGYMVCPKVVMMGSLKPHTDVHGMFPRSIDIYVTYGGLHDITKILLVSRGPDHGDSGSIILEEGSDKVQ